MDQTGEPVPVHSLLREQAGMLEAEGLQMEGQRISLTEASSEKAGYNESPIHPADGRTPILRRPWHFCGNDRFFCFQPL